MGMRQSNVPEKGISKKIIFSGDIGPDNKLFPKNQDRIIVKNTIQPKTLIKGAFIRW